MGRYPTALTAQDRLPTKLLTGGLYDLAPLAGAESVITGEHLAATTAEGWDDLSLDEAMARVHDPFINHYTGKRIATEPEAKASR